MTSDGISTADWQRVHSLAVEVANAEEDSSREREARTALKSFLAELRGRYGEKPSILATEADYASDPNESRGLLVRAYELATALSDVSSLKEISLSLADLHVTELHDLDEARHWLAISRQWIDATKELDWDEYCSNERSITAASK
ncbi:MAG: hypothetical protein KJ066_21525 [Acidobacteria bacterium]|nr:hypothetical protein [Acidobacteriota bacterium]